MASLKQRLDDLTTQLAPGVVPVLEFYPDGDPAGRVEFLNMLTGDILEDLPAGGRVVARCAIDLEAL